MVLRVKVSREGLKVNPPGSSGPDPGAEGDELMNLFVNTDQSKPIFFYDNGNYLTRPSNSPSMYVFRKTTDPTATLANYSSYILGGITLLEQI